MEPAGLRPGDVPSGRRDDRSNGAAAPRDRYGLHIALFLLTLASTVYAGAGMAGRDLLYEASQRWIEIGPLRLSVDYLLDGLRFGGSLLLFLTVHEFGHFFAARYHGVRTSLPYFIPFPYNGIGTFGAVIRIRDQVPSTRKLFDIGIAGPLAGFVVALGLVVYAMATLEPPTYVLDLAGHEALKDWVARSGEFPPTMLPEPGMEEGYTLVLGQTPLFWMLSQFFDHVPPMWELYHYPVLFAGWLGLFFTALNLLPVGQLDGGHVLYALLGTKRHSIVARGFILVLLISGAIGFAVELEPAVEGSPLLGIASWVGLAALLFFYLYRILDRRLVLAGWATVAVMGLVSASLVIGPAATGFGYSGWLIWTLLVVLLIRVDHPPVLYREPLATGRRIAAWVAIVLFVLCFSLQPLSLV